MRLSRYLNKQVAQTSGAILIVLLLIFISQQFVRYLGDVVDSKIAPELLFSMVALQMPPLAGFLIPLAVYLGILVAFGQLYVDNELTVTRSFGVGDKALLKMMIPIGVLATIIAAVTALVVTPWAGEKQQELLKQQDSKSELALLSPGKFQSTKDGKAVLYAANSPASDRLEQFYFFELPTEQNVGWQIITSNGIAISASPGDESQSLNLSGGNIYQLPVRGLNIIDSSFDEYSMPVFDNLAVDRKPKLRSVSSLDLLLRSDNEAVAELHWRLSVPLSVFILLLIAVPMARVQPRQGKFAKMLPALLLYLSYIILLLLNKGLIEDGKLPNYFGLWFVHGLFLIVAVLQYRHTHRHIKKSPTGHYVRGQK